MKHHTLTNWTIYRWRYVLGYGALILLFIAVVTAAGVYAPGGLSQQEIDMIGVTNQVDPFKPATYAVTNLPFHLLQSLSFLLLGATIFSVKLPAIILSIAVAISLFGFQSGAALATVVGVLVEVPVMLSVVRIVHGSRGWYEGKRA